MEDQKLSPKLRKKTRMPTFPTSSQLCTRSSSPSNLTRKRNHQEEEGESKRRRNKGSLNWKGRSKESTRNCYSKMTNSLKLQGYKINT
jgi:hypothetical protein